MSRHRRRTSLAALVAIVALGAAGCGVEVADDASSLTSGGGGGTAGGGGGGGTVVIEPGTFEGTGGAVHLRDAAETTSEVTSQSMTMDMTMSDIPMMGDISIVAEGSFDNETGQGHMTMDMGDMFAMEDLGTEDLPPDAGVMEMILDGDDVYVKSSLFEMMGEGDHEWYRTDADDMTADTGGAAQSDPSEFLEFLQAAGGEIEEVGEEEVRGVETMHVRTVLDLEKMMAESSEEEQAEMEESLEGLGAAGEGFEEIPAEAWIDEDGYVRKLTMEFDFASAGGGTSELGEASMLITIELYDFNEPVEIEVPSEYGEMPAGTFGS